MRCCEKARWRSLIAKPPPEGTYIASVVRLALAALLTAAVLANIGKAACAQRILWKRRRNGQAKHISVEQAALAAGARTVIGRNGQAKHISVEHHLDPTLPPTCMRRNGQAKHISVEPLDNGCRTGGLFVATVRQSTIRLNDIKRRLGLGCVPHVATVNQSTIVAILR